MTSAREQAREEARRVAAWCKVADTDARKIADSASNVWELLLREAYDMLQFCELHGPREDQESLMAKIKEALSD